MIGYQAGASYTLACCKYLERQSPDALILGAVLVAPMGPYMLSLPYLSVATQNEIRADTDRPYYLAHEDLARETHAGRTKSRRDTWHHLYARGVINEEDEKYHQRIAVDNMRYGTRSVDGMLTDSKLMTKDWGFTLDDVGFEGIRIFMPSDAGFANWKMGQAIARKLPSSKLTVMGNVTAQSILAAAGEQILQGMLKGPYLPPPPPKYRRRSRW